MYDQISGYTVDMIILFIIAGNPGSSDGQSKYSYDF